MRAVATKRLECSDVLALALDSGRQAKEGQLNFSFTSHCGGRSYEQQSIGRSGIGSDDRGDD